MGDASLGGVLNAWRLVVAFLADCLNYAVITITSSEERQ
jgi:hypothetical protein